MQWKDSGNSDFEQPPAGTALAICTRIIDLGTQKGEYQGKATSKRQVIVGWELPNDLMSEGDNAGKPFSVSKFYTASLNEKANLRKDLENWRGRAFTEQELGGFAAKSILGKPCLLSLTPNDKGRIRVTGVMAAPRGTTVPQQCNGSIFFSLDEYDPAVFEGLSDGYKKMITLAPEYQEIAQGKRQGKGGAFDDFDSDSIPF